MSDQLNRLKWAVEGECDGLALTDEQARNILAYLAIPAAPAVQADITDWLNSDEGRAAIAASQANTKEAIASLNDARHVGADDLNAPFGSQPDADPNAPWLTLAHAICTDAGVAHGFITDRLNQLRELIAPAMQNPVAWMWKMHGWAITAHSKNRAVQTFVDVSRPPTSTIESPDFISLTPLCAAPVPAIPSKTAHDESLQLLADQAQELDMGYGPNACPTCGKSQPEWTTEEIGRVAVEYQVSFTGNQIRAIKYMLAAAPQSPVPQDVKDAKRLNALESLLKKGNRLSYRKGLFWITESINYEFDAHKTVREAIDAAIAAQGNGQNI